MIVISHIQPGVRSKTPHTEIVGIIDTDCLQSAFEFFCKQDMAYDTCDYNESDFEIDDAFDYKATFVDTTNDDTYMFDRVSQVFKLTDIIGK